MSMSDQVIVMNHGVIAQSGTPKEVYHNPTNDFVAEFLGNSNALEAKVVDGKILLGSQVVISETNMATGNVKIIIRASEIAFAPREDCNVVLHGICKGCMYSGSYYRYLIEIEGQEIFADSEHELSALEKVVLYLPEKRIHAYAAK